MAVVVLVACGFAQWRHAENLRTDAQLETLGVAVLRGDPVTTRARQVTDQFGTRWHRGLWGSREFAGAPEEVLRDLRTSTDAASLDPPFCVVPTERNRGIIRTVDHTLLDATYICEVSRGRQHWGRVVVRVPEDGAVEITFALGPHSMTRRIRQHFVDDEPVDLGLGSRSTGRSGRGAR